MCPKNALKAEFKGLWVGQEILETNLTVALSNVRLPPGQIKCTWFKKLSICLCSGQVQIVYSVWAVNLEMLQGSSHESLSITTTYSLSPTFYISWLLMWYTFRNGNRILWRDTLIWGLRIKTMTRFESGHPCWLLHWITSLSCSELLVENKWLYRVILTCKWVTSLSG